MTALAHEFVYKLPGTARGSRPGAHRSRSRGAGMIFATHARLFDQPDPRRIDLRASINNVHHDWLVRSHYQRSALRIKAIVDVSPSMHVGTAGNKLGNTARFLDALGFSAQRSGDPVSLMAFDHEFRDDLFMPARLARGHGTIMANAIRDCIPHQGQTASLDGLTECINRIAGSEGIVFLVSDFHWPLDQLSPMLDKLLNNLVVPIVIWDPAETIAPAQGNWLSLRDAETNRIRQLWLSKKIRRQWHDNVDRRRAQISALFAANDIYPFHVDGRFDAELLTQYFLERVV